MKISIVRKNLASLTLDIDGKDVVIKFPVDSMAGYKSVVNVMKKYQAMAKAQELLVDEKMDENKAVDIMDQSIDLMESFRDAVRVGIREEYNKHLKPIEDDIPFTAWLQILTAILKEYSAYFEGVTSTKGEL